MSRPTARHRRTHLPAAPSPRRLARHRKPSPLATALQDKPAQFAAAAAAGTLIVSAGPAAAHWASHSARPAATAQAPLSAVAADIGLGVHPGAQAGSGPLASPTRSAQPTATASPSPSPRPTPTPTATAQPTVAQATAQPVYRNPLRDVSGLIPERIDMGADFGGSGPVYAIGDGVVTNAQGNNGGWPGGGWITYKLTDGPDAGLMVYVAEDVTPQVQVGQQVTSSTVVATMYNGGDGIETGWAMADGASAESQLPEAGGISGNGPFPTMIGMNFEELLQHLGVPAGNNWSQSAYGTLPAGYPTSW